MLLTIGVLVFTLNSQVFTAPIEIVGSETGYAEAFSNLEPYMEKVETEQGYIMVLDDLELLSQKTDIDIELIHAVRNELKVDAKVSVEEYNQARDLLAPYVREKEDGTYMFTKELVQLNQELNIDIDTIQKLQYEMFHQNYLIQKGELEEVRIGGNIKVFKHIDGRIEVPYNIKVNELNDTQRETILKLMNYNSQDIEKMFFEIEVDIIKNGGKKAIIDSEEENYVITSLPSWITDFSGWTHYSGSVMGNYIHTHYVRVERSDPLGWPLRNHIGLAWSERQERKSNTDYAYAQYRDGHGWHSNNTIYSVTNEINGTYARWNVPNPQTADIAFLREDVYVSHSYDGDQMAVLVGYGHNFLPNFSVTIKAVSIDFSTIGSVQDYAPHNFRAGYQ